MNRALKALGPDFVENERGDLCHAPQRFDVYDDALFHDLIGSDQLGKPVQDLCVLADGVVTTAGSFNVDYTRLGQQAAPLLIALLKACREKYREEA